MSFEKYLVTQPQLAQAMRWNVDDSSLSGSQRSLAVIVNALLEHADRLDVSELRTLSETLHAYTQDVEQRENAAWKIIMERTRPTS